MPKIETLKEWRTAPISCTCEVMVSHHPLAFCEKATVAAYPAMGGGWMALCECHARKHLEIDGAILTDVLIARGETWK